MTSMPEVLTAAQVAELLDCAPETVEARTRERRLPAVQYGRSWVYPREALLRVLADQALAHVAAAPAAAPASPPPAPKVLPLAPRPVQRQQRSRGRSPAPLPDPPAGAA